MITITIKKTHLYGAVIVMALVGAFVLGFYFGSSDGRPIPAPPVPIPAPAPELAMTQAEARLTRGAIELTREDVIRGSLPSTAMTLDALRSLLPRSVRDAVMRELGTPGIDDMLDALDVLEGKLPE